MIWNTALTIMHAVGLASCAAMLLWVMPAITLFLASHVRRVWPLQNGSDAIGAPKRRIGRSKNNPAIPGWTRELKRLWKHLAHFCDSALTH